MGIDLEALANELRALDIESTFEGEFIQIGELPGVVRVISDGSLWFSGQCTADFAGIIIPAVARHLGAGQPVAADRAALVERVKAGIEMFLGDWLDASYGPYDQLANLSVSAVEAAGWGPRAEPVAPPEPLSAGEMCHLQDVAIEAFERGDESVCEALEAVLAALPARFPVPVEGA